jgi:hypothetical protein
MEDSKRRAEALNQQCISFSTNENMTNKPELKGNPSPDISHLEIFEEGVNKLLSNVNPRKANGPDNIPNRVLKGVAIPHESLFFDFIYCQTKCPITGVFLSPSLSTSNNCDIYNPRKANGPDNIPNRVLKDCATNIAPYATTIYQKSYEVGSIPDD